MSFKKTSALSSGPREDARANDPVPTVDVVDLLPLAGANWTPGIRTKAQRLLNAVANNDSDAGSNAVSLAVGMFEAICPALTLAMAVKPGGTNTVARAMPLAELVLGIAGDNGNRVDDERTANAPSCMAKGVVGGQREVA